MEAGRAPMNTEAAFSTTRWTLVIQAGDESPQSSIALRELCEIYYEPVVFFILRWRNQQDENQARDQAHSFFESLLNRQSIGKPDSNRGNFRNYLLGAVRNFLLEQDRAAGVKKRGGDVTHEPLDEDQPAPSVAESIFDREWALAIVGRALSELESEMLAADKADQFETLKPCLDGKNARPQSEIASELGISESAVKVAIHRLRERFRTKVRAEVAATLLDPKEIDSEMQYLITALAHQG